MSTPLEQAKLMIKYKYGNEVRTVLKSIIKDGVYVEELINKILPTLDDTMNLFNIIKGQQFFAGKVLISGANEADFNKMMATKYENMRNLSKTKSLDSVAADVNLSARTE